MLHIFLYIQHTPFTQNYIVPKCCATHILCKNSQYHLSLQQTKMLSNICNQSIKVNLKVMQV